MGKDPMLEIINGGKNDGNNNVDDSNITVNNTNNNINDVIQCNRNNEMRQ